MQMKKALIVGINHYDLISSLSGCVNDAYELKSVLDRHADGTKNFDVQLCTSSSNSEPLTRTQLRQKIEQLFSGNADTAIFYFAGHGYLDSLGGYLCATDTAHGHDGLSLHDVISISNSSNIRNRIIILDCCHSGIAASANANNSISMLKEGTTILTASTATQAAAENATGGVFTYLLIDALNGAAANLLGEITPGSIYAHIDQSLGPWQQRPVFKTNVDSFVSLRRALSPVTIDDLHKLTEFFPTSSYVYPLDPSFEPERSEGQESLPPPDEANTMKFSILQKLNRVNLVVPDDAPHMWHAAIESKGCRLTVLGEHYRRLVEQEHI